MRLDKIVATLFYVVQYALDFDVLNLLSNQIVKDDFDIFLVSAFMTSSARSLLSENNIDSITLIISNSTHLSNSIVDISMLSANNNDAVVSTIALSHIAMLSADNLDAVSTIDLFAIKMLSANNNDACAAIADIAQTDD